MLEDLIGELQSEWGVPQYPQEYRITIKVAESRQGNGGSTSSPAAPADAAAKPEQDGGPKREKAPGMARMASGDGTDKPPSRRRRRRRKRRSP